MAFALNTVHYFPTLKIFSYGLLSHLEGMHGKAYLVSESTHRIYIVVKEVDSGAHVKAHQTSRGKSGRGLGVKIDVLDGRGKAMCRSTCQRTGKRIGSVATLQNLKKHLGQTLSTPH